MVYPTGSIYLSMKNTSPITLFGGQWSNIYDFNNPRRCLIPASPQSTININSSVVPTHSHEYRVAHRLYYSAAGTGDADRGFCFLARYSTNNETTFIRDNQTIVQNNLTTYLNASVTAARKQVETWDEQAVGNTNYLSSIPPHTLCYAWYRTS